MTDLSFGLGFGLILGSFALVWLIRISGSFRGRALRQGLGADCRACTLTANDGSPFPLAGQLGKVVLLVNTASRCGFTRQYTALEALWQRLRGRGLVIVAVPTNDFLGQEPGSDADIAQFCQLNHTTFPLMRKTTTRGGNATDVYALISRDPVLGGPIRWNFEKCLIDRQGRLRARIAPRVAPDDPRCLALIEVLLDET